MERVRKAFSRLSEQISLMIAGEKGELGKGSQYFAQALALVNATRAQLPEKYKVRGLVARMAWLAYYAELVQTGKVMKNGESVKTGIAGR